jgi:hypothetical protein
VMALGVLAFWAFDALPFQDLPAHAGILAIRERYAASAFDQHYYKLGPILGPYALFLGLGDVLAHVLRPLGAVRALATLPVLATPLALLFARRRLHGDDSLWAGFFGVALSFGFLTILGLASYLFGLALALVALTLWLLVLDDVDASRPTARRELGFGVAALVVGLAHGFALAVLALSAALCALAGGKRLAKVLRLRAFVPALTVGAWSALRGGPPPGSAGTFQLVPSADYQTLLDKLSLLLTPTLMTRTGVDVAVGIAVWAVVLAAFLKTTRDTSVPQGEADSRSRAHARALAVAAAGTALAFFALPHALSWFGFIDGRMVPVFLFLAILSVRRPALGPRLTRGLDGVAPAAALGMTALVLFASQRFQGEAAGYREVLAAVPREASVLNLPLDPDSAWFTAHPFVHYDKLVAIDRDVLLSDVWPDRATALYATPDNPQVRLPPAYNSANLKRIDWPAYDLSEWSHVLVRTRPGAPAPSAPGDLDLVQHVGGFWLYRARPRSACGSSPSASAMSASSLGRD